MTWRADITTVSVTRTRRGRNRLRVVVRSVHLGPYGEQPRPTPDPYPLLRPQGSAIVGYTVRSGVVIWFGSEGGWVGLRQLYCVVKLPHPSCRRGATPGPDGALDARQGMGLPPGPIGRVEILVGTACGARPSSSPSPPVDDAYATRLGFDHRLPGRVSSDSDLTTGSRAGTVSLAWQHGGRDGGGEGGAGARRLRRRRRRAEDGARITIPGLGPEGRVS